ncbi:hypothetical protein FQN54_007774 [Arachnomyces sp. PD_36]|nr:hypothetical protein FQN54_007774 [Arachnomyces sp. PD_36]
MQEHIRRAHPSHYIPKLPATEESFQLMVNTPLDQRSHPPPQPQQQQQQQQPASAIRRADHNDRDPYGADGSSPATPRTIEEAHPAAATAAVALAQLHHHRLNNSEWDSELDTHSENDLKRERMRSSIELPPLRDHLKGEQFTPFQSSRPRELLPSILAHSPPGRSTTLPPIQRRDKQRPRKSSVTQSARKAKHERNRSKEFGRRPSLNDRKALSAEPQTAAWMQGKRWEDLIEAATSATEVDDERDRDLTPVPHSPSIPPRLGSTTSVPSASKNRSSLPPAFQSTPGLQSHRPFQPLSYTASPLQKALTPPPYEPHGGPDNDLEPFPSVESSLDSTSTVSGKNFHMSATGLPNSVHSDSSPVQPPNSLSNPHPSSHPRHQHHHPPRHPRPQHSQSNPPPFFRGSDVQIYCAACNRPWLLRECFACTECICGICRECVGMMVGMQGTSMMNITSSPGNGVTTGNGAGGRPSSLPTRRGCPRCGTVGGRWKGFQLDFR